MSVAPEMSVDGDDDDSLPVCRSLESLSLGGVAAMRVQPQLPRRSRRPRPGEISTYLGAGIVPVCRLADGEVRVLLWQPQKGQKMGVRWFDLGGKKNDKVEFSSRCACRKFAKQTYGLFGCELDLRSVPEEALDGRLAELYHGLANLPLMLKTSQDWAQMQILSDPTRVFYSDIHEYHVYLLNVPYVPAEVFWRVSQIVDGGKRWFQWLGQEDIVEEVLAPRLHTKAFADQLLALNRDPWIRTCEGYGERETCAARSAFSAAVIPSIAAELPSPSVAAGRRAAAAAAGGVAAQGNMPARSRGMRA